MKRRQRPASVTWAHFEGSISSEVSCSSFPITELPGGLTCAVRLVQSIVISGNSSKVGVAVGADVGVGIAVGEGSGVAVAEGSEVAVIVGAANTALVGEVAVIVGAANAAVVGEVAGEVSEEQLMAAISTSTRMSGALSSFTCFMLTETWRGFQYFLYSSETMF